MGMRSERGFTLIEVVVVAAIIAILAGILVPMIFSQVDGSKLARAQADVKSIQTSILVFRKDTGQWPQKQNGACDTLSSMLTTNGSIPNVMPAGWSAATPDNIVNYAGIINPCYTNWKGPYLTAFDPDPWGNAYLVSSNGFASDNAVWVVSTGPDGLLQTDAADSSLQGDDIGLRIK